LINGGPNQDFIVVLYGHIWYNSILFPHDPSETTKNSYCHTKPYPNYPPNQPSTPLGPNSVKVGETHSWSSSTTDPNGDRIYIRFNWGDGSSSNWAGPYDSGATVAASHAYSTKGNYQITSQAQDEHGLNSVLSNPLTLGVTKDSSTPDQGQSNGELPPDNGGCPDGGSNTDPPIIQ
jgi:hypothetical protein